MDDPRHPPATDARLGSMQRLLGAILVCSVCACGDDSQPDPDPGALIEVTMDSQVGVLLDELPADVREVLAAQLLAGPASFWEARARRQISTALYRLVYRNFYGDGIGQLPLPPVEKWELTVGAPERVT